MKIIVEIPEVHKSTVTIDVPKGTTREKMCELAMEAHNEADELNMEYSHTIEDKSQWTVRTEDGDFVT